MISYKKRKYDYSIYFDLFILCSWRFLASIVEREERDSSQKPIVADILAKRVKEGIPMGADATVCYGYAKTQKQCTPTFIGSVIHEKSAYNTRNKQ